jgi:hypothetical protein
LFSSLQHSPEHFLEIKMESYNTRFFHLKEDFAYTEVTISPVSAVKIGSIRFRRLSFKNLWQATFCVNAILHLDA